MPSSRILTGDCLAVLPTLADNSVDAIVTDPPYGLSNTTSAQVAETITQWVSGDRTYIPGGRGFMGASWDAFVPPVAVWDECLRVLKPGGHLLAFAGTRTQDLMGLGIRLAGFEIRDSLAWLMGSGFPKSLNVSGSDSFCQCEPVPYIHGAGDVQRVRKDVPDASGMAEASEEPDVLTPVQRGSSRSRMGEARSRGAEEARSVRPSLRRGQPSLEGRGDVQAAQGELHRTPVRPLPIGTDGDGAQRRLRDGAPTSDGALDRETADTDRVREPHQQEPSGQPQGKPGVVPDERGSQARRGWPVCAGCGKPVVPKGLGTALKPGHEPVICARKPLIGTVAQTVLEWGTGAVNVDGCRIGTTGGGWNGLTAAGGTWNETTTGLRKTGERSAQSGRWPANVVLDEDAAAELDEQSGTLKSHGLSHGKVGAAGYDGGWKPSETVRGHDDTGGASRYFYTALDSPVGSSERTSNPTPGALGALPIIAREGELCRTATGSELPATFYYCAKAPKRERPSYTKPDGTVIQHATVKPLTLMRWLVRLVTPPGGTVLDTFAGSGATVEAALLEGFDVVAIEREAEYVPLIEQRIARAMATIQAAPEPDLDLFSEDVPAKPQGRWPANVILDRTSAEALDEQSGILHSQDPATRGRNNTARPGGMFGPPSDYGGYSDKGGASRFFLVADDEPAA